MSPYPMTREYVLFPGFVKCLKTCESHQHSPQAKWLLISLLEVLSTIGIRLTNESIQKGYRP